MKNGSAQGGGARKGQTHTASPRKYLIRTSEFVGMAEKIAATTPKVEVPSSLTAAFSCAIKLRRKETRFVKFFGSHDKSTQQGHHTHAYFTENVLAKAFGLLHTSAVPLAKDPTANDTPQMQPDVASVGDMMSDLTTDQPSDQEEIPVNTLPQVEIEFDDVEVEVEFFWLIQVFLEDVMYVRQYVRQVWEAYKKSDLENIVASLFTIQQYM
jgi:hypothetical protein